MKWHCGREPTSRPTVHNTNMMYVLRTMSAMVRPVRTADLAIGSDFFFSSRRRHTRFSRDWSSDVCLPIFAHALEQPIARWSYALVHRYQRFTHEPRQKIDHAFGQTAEGGRKIDDGIDRPALHEDTQPGQ